MAWQECKSAVICRLAQAAQTENGRGLRVEKFAGQWMLLHCVFLRQYFKHLKIENHDLKQTLRELMTVPFVRRMRFYYYAGAAFIWFQQFLANLRTYGLSRMRKAGPEN